VLSFLGFKRKAKPKAKRVLLPEHQRAAVRLDVTVPGSWRFAPGGKAVGDYLRGSVTDISRTGASLIVDRDIKSGSRVELKLTISTAAQPLVLLCEVVRATKVEVSAKWSLGLRFLGITAEEDRTIMDFINKRQAERRSRGLA
jgi:c-di-GMP-binding flagellar brake protein YcgR